MYEKQKRDHDDESSYQYQPTIINQNIQQQGNLPKRNNLALWMGFIFGLFGMLGVAHIINGKLGSGLALLVIGSPVFAVIAVAVHSLALGLILPLFLTIPLHILIVWNSAKAGASST